MQDERKAVEMKTSSTVEHATKTWCNADMEVAGRDKSGNTEVRMCSKGRLLGMPFTLTWAGWTSVLALIVPVQTVLGPCLCSRLTDFLPQNQASDHSFKRAWC